MVVSLLSTYPAANGVRRMPTTYATPDFSHLQSLDDLHTGWFSAFCHLWSQEVKPASIYWAQATCKDRVALRTHSHSFWFFFFLVFFCQGHRVWWRLEQETWVLTFDHIPLHACRRPATWPLWPPVSSAGSRRVGCGTCCSLLLDLTFS